jgi:N-acetylmuramoyl-L-alanine amidase
MVRVFEWLHEETQNKIENKDIILEENEKNQFTICIDPGHQRQANYELEAIGPGSDIQKPKVSQGGVGIFTQKEEYELTLEISLKLKEKLESSGYQVVLTRQSHDVNISNKERAVIANENKADIFIRIHADQNKSQALKGISILSPSENNVYTKAIYEPSHNLAKLVLEEMLASTEANDRGIYYRDDISGFNWSEVPVILVELGFMSNKEEDIKLSLEVYQKSLVEGMFQGINNYFEMMK